MLVGRSNSAGLFPTATTQAKFGFDEGTPDAYTGVWKSTSAGTLDTKSVIFPTTATPQFLVLRLAALLSVSRPSVTLRIPDYNICEPPLQ